MERKNFISNDGKQKKQSEILNLLRVRGPLPRIDISSNIQLTKAAITRLANEMIQAGCLVERGEIQSAGPPPHRRGRRKIILDINENYRLAFGVLVERDRLQIGLTNLKGQILSHFEADVAGCGYRDLLERIVSQINSIVRDNCIPPELILGGGICLSAREEDPAPQGANVDDRLARVKMDLSHALDFPLTAVPTCMGALMAQQLFADYAAKDLLLLRVGELCGCSVMTNGQIYRGFTRQAGGLDRALARALPLPGGFAGLEGQPEQADDFRLFNECLCEIVANCAATLDPERVVAFGDYMETELAISRLNNGLAASAPDSWRLRPAFVTERTAFLAGCAAAIARYFYRMEI